MVSKKPVHLTVAVVETGMIYRWKAVYFLHLSSCFPNCYHSSITVTSQWARWRLKSPASPLFTQPFIQVQIKENIKAPQHWLLCGEFTGDRWIPAKMASNAEYVSIWWRHHGFDILPFMCWSLHMAKLMPLRIKSTNSTTIKSPPSIQVILLLKYCSESHKEK